jgi:hypothetical protein
MARGNDPYTLRRRDQRTAEEADRAEFDAILRGPTSADAGVYGERIAGTLDDLTRSEDGDREPWEARDLQFDTAVGHVIEEIQRRSRMMGGAYPFAIDGGRVSYSASRSGFYEFCLATSCSPNITAGDYVSFPRVFERVTALLLKGYIGGEAEVLHTGAPRDREVGTRFKDSLGALHERSGEWRWRPDEGLPDDPSTVGDEGVDFVVWLKSLDGRPGQLFLLAQCACGGDWDQKLTDVSIARMVKWVNPKPFVDPVRIFTTPHHLSDGNLIETQREAGLVFDRARLSIIAEKLADEPQLIDWRDRLNDAARLVLKPLGE